MWAKCHGCPFAACAVALTWRSKPYHVQASVPSYAPIIPHEGVPRAPRSKRLLRLHRAVCCSAPRCKSKYLVFTALRHAAPREYTCPPRSRATQQRSAACRMFSPYAGQMAYNDRIPNTAAWCGGRMHPSARPGMHPSARSRTRPGMLPQAPGLTPRLTPKQVPGPAPKQAPGLTPRQAPKQAPRSTEAGAAKRDFRPRSHHGS